LLQQSDGFCIWNIPFQKGCTEQGRAAGVGKAEASQGEPSGSVVVASSRLRMRMALRRRPFLGRSCRARAIPILTGVGNSFSKISIVIIALLKFFIDICFGDNLLAKHIEYSCRAID